MLKSITVLDKLKPLNYLHDNIDFRNNLKLLAPFFQFNFETATQEDYEMFYYNLLYLAQRDLSLAHCVQHNHKSRVAIECGPDHAAKEQLSKLKYHEVVGCYSSHRAVDTVRYDPVTNTVTPGVKGWLSNLKSADMCVIEVADISAPAFSSAHIQHVPGVTPDIYTVYIDLSKIDHSRTDGTVSPTAAGMKGAAPGVLTINEPIPVGTDSCYLVKLNPRQDLGYTWLGYVRQCWVTVHFGVILGLYKELLKYPELKDPMLAHRIRSMELEISSLKIMWEHGLQTKLLTDNTVSTQNPVIGGTATNQMRDTQYALSKKILLDLIHLVLEIGLNDFVDDNTPQWVRFKDAISYVTHMASLYRCNSKYDSYNNLLY